MLVVVIPKKDNKDLWSFHRQEYLKYASQNLIPFAIGIHEFQKLSMNDTVNMYIYVCRDLRYWGLLFLKLIMYSYPSKTCLHTLTLWTNSSRETKITLLHIYFSQNLIISFGTSFIYPKTTCQQILIEFWYKDSSSYTFSQTHILHQIYLKLNYITSYNRVDLLKN